MLGARRAPLGWREVLRIQNGSPAVVAQVEPEKWQTICLLGSGSSGSPALIAMMKTADPRDRGNRSGIGRLYVARFRTNLLQG